MKLVHYALVTVEERPARDIRVEHGIALLRLERDRSPEAWDCRFRCGWSADVTPKGEAIEAWIWAPAAEAPAMFVRVELQVGRTALVLTDHDEDGLKGADLAHCLMIARTIAWAWLPDPHHTGGV